MSRTSAIKKEKKKRIDNKEALMKAKTGTSDKQPTDVE